MWATERLILLVCQTSFSCLAISSPERYWLFAGTSIVQICLYSGLRVGRIWSRLSCANCVFKWTNIAMLSTDFVIRPVLFWVLVANQSVVCKFMMVTLHTSCWKLANFKSAFFCVAVSCPHISGFTRMSLSSGQFAGHLCFATISLIFSGLSFSPQRFLRSSATSGLISVWSLGNLWRALLSRDYSAFKCLGPRAGQTCKCCLLWHHLLELHRTLVCGEVCVPYYMKFWRHVNLAILKNPYLATL